MIAPAMEQDERRGVGIAPIGIMQARALRDVALRCGADEFHRPPMLRCGRFGKTLHLYNLVIQDAHLPANRKSRIMPAIDIPQPEFMEDEEISIFAGAVGKFYEKHAPEKRVLQWREDGQVEREISGTRTGEAAGGCSVPRCRRNMAAMAAISGTRWW